MERATRKGRSRKQDPHFKIKAYWYKPGSGCVASTRGYNQRNDSKEQKEGREGEGEEGRRRKERKKGRREEGKEKVCSRKISLILTFTFRQSFSQNRGAHEQAKDCHRTLEAYCKFGGVVKNQKWA